MRRRLMLAVVFCLYDAARALAEQRAVSNVDVLPRRARRLHVADMNHHHPRSGVAVCSEQRKRIGS